MTACAVYPAASQTLSGCAVFPSNSIWNTPVDRLPLDTNSAAYINTIGAAKGLHPDFSSGIYGIPYVVVPGTQAKVPVSFTYASESDPGPYPIPPNRPRGWIREHRRSPRIVLDNDDLHFVRDCTIDTAAERQLDGESGAVFDLKSINCVPPAGRRLTRRGCRFCRASCAMTKWRPDRSITRSA